MQIMHHVLTTVRIMMYYHAFPFFAPFENIIQLNAHTEVPKKLTQYYRF